MAGVEESSPYREDLLYMINAIARILPMRMEDQVLIVLSLDTDEKIDKWFEWLRPHVIGVNELNVTEVEIIRAAVMIGKGKM